MIDVCVNSAWIFLWIKALGLIVLVHVCLLAGLEFSEVTVTGPGIAFPSAGVFGGLLPSDL